MANRDYERSRRMEYEAERGARPMDDGRDRTAPRESWRGSGLAEDARSGPPAGAGFGGFEEGYPSGYHGRRAWDDRGYRAERSDRDEWREQLEREWRRNEELRARDPRQEGPDQGRFRGGERRWFGRGPKSYVRSDQRIHEEINEELYRSPMNSENVEVTVKGGEVTLTGWVESRRDKRDIEDVVDGCFGVKDVHNQLKVGAPEPAGGKATGRA